MCQCNAGSCPSNRERYVASTCKITSIFTYKIRVEEGASLGYHCEACRQDELSNSRGLSIMPGSRFPRPVHQIFEERCDLWCYYKLASQSFASVSSRDSCRRARLN